MYSSKVLNLITEKGWPNSHPDSFILRDKAGWAPVPSGLEVAEYRKPRKNPYESLYWRSSPGFPHRANPNLNQIND